MPAHVRRRLRLIQFKGPVSTPAAELSNEPRTRGESVHSVHVLASEPILPPLMCGWIRKEGGTVLRSYNERYFVLYSTSTSSTLMYFLKEPRNVDENSDGDPACGQRRRGSIDLKGATFRRGKKYSVLASAYRKQKYLLDLQSCPQCEEWVEAIRAHIDFAQSRTSPVVAIPVTPLKEAVDDVNPDSSPAPNDVGKNDIEQVPSPMSDTEFINDSSAYQYIYVYERWQPLVEWGNSYPGHILPTDKGKYSNRSCTFFSFDMNKVIPPLPENWFPLTEFVPVSEVRSLSQCSHKFLMVLCSCQGGEKEHWEYSFNFINSKWHQSKQLNCEYITMSSTYTSLSCCN